MQFVVFEKISKWLFIPNYTRKIMWLRIYNIHEKIRDSLSWLCKSKASASGAKIIYSNLQVTLCVRSKQPRTIKTIIYNDIFTSLGHKKFKVRPNSSRNCWVCSAFYSVFVCFTVFTLFFSCCIVGERKPTWNAGHCFARKFSAYPNVATSEARIWLAICEFLWLLTNQNVWFVSFFALN